MGQGPTRLYAALAVAVFAFGATWDSARAEPRYDVGATDNTIKIGNVAASSGALSIYRPYGEALSRCFAKINAEGGINKRKIEFITYDDGYSPPKTVEQTRKLIESDEVLFLLGSIGGPTSLATAAYLANKHIPHLFIATSSSRVSDANLYPWMMGWQPVASQEGAIFGRYLREQMALSKVGILYQNDDYGRDFLSGLKEGLGDKEPIMLVSAKSYESTEPTVTSQLAQIKAAGVDVIYLAATGKFVAQSLKGINELGWKPTILIPYTANSTTSVLKNADLKGDEKLISSSFFKDLSDPAYANDPDIRQWSSWIDQYYPTADRSEVYIAWGWSICNTAAHILKEAGEDLTRENILRLANSFSGFAPPLVLPGITLSSTPAEHRLIKCLRMRNFANGSWRSMGELVCSQ
jgi:branched-chain amino acid transport system substrate-binding protein